MTIRSLPHDLKDIPSVTAELWVRIDRDAVHPGVEGPVFDREGNLFVCRTPPPEIGGEEARILKITPDGSISTVFRGEMPLGIAIHRDGRMFVTDPPGKLLELDPAGQLIRTLPLTGIPGGGQQLPDGITFDFNGDLYYTDVQGGCLCPSGGVYRLTAESDYTCVEPFITGIAGANGISITEDGRLMWITSSGENSLLRVELTAERRPPAPRDIRRIYSFNGIGHADTNRIDSAGNVYQAFMQDGRALVLDPLGNPRLNLLLPGRDEGKNLMSPNLVLKPGTTEGYLIAGGTDGNHIFRFDALAPAAVPFSHT